MAGDFIYESEINFATTEGGSTFNKNVELNIKPGLYYFYIALSDEKPLVAGKFLVENGT